MVFTCTKETRCVWMRRRRGGGVVAGSPFSNWDNLIWILATLQMKLPPLKAFPPPHLFSNSTGDRVSVCRNPLLLQQCHKRILQMAQDFVTCEEVLWGMSPHTHTHTRPLINLRSAPGWSCPSFADSRRYQSVHGWSLWERARVQGGDGT
jgi:hypothetical protein